MRTMCHVMNVENCNVCTRRLTARAVSMSAWVIQCCTYVPAWLDMEWHGISHCSYCTYCAAEAAEAAESVVSSTAIGINSHDRCGECNARVIGGEMVWKMQKKTKETHGKHSLCVESEKQLLLSKLFIIGVNQKYSVFHTFLFSSSQEMICLFFLWLRIVFLIYCRRWCRASSLLFPISLNSLSLSLSRSVIPIDEIFSLCFAVFLIFISFFFRSSTGQRAQKM